MPRSDKRSSVIAGLEAAIHRFATRLYAKRMDHANPGIPGFAHLSAQVECTRVAWSSARATISGRSGALGCMLALIAFPWIESDRFVLHVASLIAIASTVAMGLQILLGRSGQLSIGQAAFYGIGAYTSALLTAKFGVAFPLALIAAGVTVGLASLVMVPITRLTGAYLAVATLGFSIIVYLVLKNEEWLTGGSYGFMGIPRAELFG